MSLKKALDKVKRWFGIGVIPKRKQQGRSETKYPLPASREKSKIQQRGIEKSYQPQKTRAEILASLGRSKGRTQPSNRTIEKAERPSNPNARPEQAKKPRSDSAASLDRSKGSTQHDNHKNKKPREQLTLKKGTEKVKRTGSDGASSLQRSTGRNRVPTQTARKPDSSPKTSCVADQINNTRDDTADSLYKSVVRTQFDDRSIDGAKQEIVIGLDFGTAFTKVVLGEIRARYAVPFEPYASKDNPYLLPSGMTILRDGNGCVLGDPAESGTWCGDLKMPIITRTIDQEGKVKVAAFLALVFQHVREWFLETHKGTYGGKRIVWLVNMGLPTDSYDDSELMELYKQIALAAWTASVMSGEISVDLVSKCLERSVKESDPLTPDIRTRLLPPDMFDCFPEFAVQLSGYVRSPRRRPDLHALVDIGAGTVDITTFNVHQNNDEEDLYPVMDQKVISAGVNFLVRARLEHFNQAEKWKSTAFVNMVDDPTFARILGVSENALPDADYEVLNQVAEALVKVLKYTKEHRYPLSRHWDIGVPTFFVGGGANVQAYKKQIKQFESLRPPSLIRIINLDAPEDLIAPNTPPDSYHRLSVAYGLSFSPEDIGEVRVKSQTEDVDAVIPDEQGTFGNRYVSQDMT